MTEATRTTDCCVCGNSSVIPVMDLPNLPLTGIYVERHEPGLGHGDDQRLMVCGDCGHAQLENVLAPSFLYGDHYAHRSSASHITPSAVGFFVDYLDKLRPGHRFSLALEVGCNDMVLLDRLLENSERVVGIDPLWRDRLPEEKPRRKVIGKFVEDVDMEGEIGGRPDLVVSTHNFEHINGVREQLRRLLDVASDDALFLFEVPDFDLMVGNLRFDQVFHQHLHYFGLASFLRLLREVGAGYIAHAYNYRNWGGTLLIAFTGGRGDIGKTPKAKVRQPDDVAARYSLFSERMAGFRRLTDGIDGPKWGYGAAQMLPVLAYHMDTDLGFLEGVLDDCPKRNGLTYPNLDVRISNPDKKTKLDDSTVIITALDAINPILNRLQDFNPRFVVVPANIF